MRVFYTQKIERSISVTVSDEYAELSGSVLDEKVGDLCVEAAEWHGWDHIEYLETSAKKE